VAPAESSSIVRLSTRDVAPADRLSYASWILSSSLAPSALSTATPSEYELEVTALELPSIAIVAQRGSPQRSIRSRPEIRRTAQRYCFLVLVVSGSWQVASVTRTRFEAGDLIFYDSRDPLDCDLLHNWNDLNLQLSEHFVRKWVPRPAVLTGRNICRESQWGRLLASYVAQLAPEFVVHAPLPQAVLIDQLGALLALTASELSGSRVVSTPVERSVRDQVHDHITQRCPDTSLHAADVATSLSISTRTLHRALAACGETFGSMLIQARVDLAVRMLQSPLFDRVTTAEVGRRAGFSDASHFVKVLRRHTGHTPLLLRRTRRG
jgi:AraC family transcriptional regulator, positive regulator of tynA and feaB